MCKLRQNWLFHGWGCVPLPDRIYFYELGTAISYLQVTEVFLCVGGVVVWLRSMACGIEPGP